MGYGQYQPTGWDAGYQPTGWAGGHQPTGWAAGPHGPVDVETIPEGLREGAHSTIHSMRASGATTGDIIAELQRLHEYRASLTRPQTQQLPVPPVTLPANLPAELHDGAHWVVWQMRASKHTEEQIVDELRRLYHYRRSLTHPSQ